LIARLLREPVRHFLLIGVVVSQAIVGDIAR